MKKILSIISLTFLLTGCAETMALLAPTGSAIGGGNILQSSFTSAASYSIKKSTGKDPLQHAIDFVEKHNPERNKEKCIDFRLKYLNTYLQFFHIKFLIHFGTFVNLLT